MGVIEPREREEEENQSLWVLRQRGARGAFELGERVGAVAAGFVRALLEGVAGLPLALACSDLGPGVSGGEGGLVIWE